MAIYTMDENLYSRLERCLKEIEHLLGYAEAAGTRGNVGCLLETMSDLA
ncbi:MULTISPECIES: hypothetical protein [unclassified Novosphingobium]|nr:MULTISPECIES: hypothetical protein [unclassified Novosphingobium]NMN89580.1 hypothetical protein [Novosphingobium sp. SG916]